MDSAIEFILGENIDLLSDRKHLNDTLSLLGTTSDRRLTPAETCEKVYRDMIDRVSPQQIGQALIHGALYVEPERFRLIAQHYHKLPLHMSDEEIIDNILGQTPELAVRGRVIMEEEIRYVIECFLGN
jgi:hypothetical protein